MNIKTTIKTLGAASLVLLLASCSNQPKNGKPLEQMGAKNGSDSVSYYYGQMMAERMYQMGRQDSMYNDPEFLEAYWEGFNKAYKLVKEGDSPADKGFNQGLAFGLQLASNMADTHNTMPEYKFNKKMFEAGYAFTIKGDTILPTQDAQMNLRSIMEGMEKRAAAKENKAIEENIEKYAKKNGFKKDKDGYYEKIVKPGNGNVFAVGDSLRLTVDFATSTNRDMKQYSMPETALVLGKTMPMTYPYAKVLLTVKSGSVIKLLMTPESLFGSAAPQFKFDKGEFIIVTLTPVFVSKTDYKGPEATLSPATPTK